MAELNEQMVELLQKNTQILDQLVTKVAAGVQTASPLHGNGGIFASPGLERDVVTAHVRPFGIAKFLPIYPSVIEDPRFAAITGFTADVGARITTSCADAPHNYMKGCNLTARFGLTRKDTNTIEFDKTMLRKNRGDFTDLLLHGQVLGLSGLTPRNLDQNGILNIITKSEMVGAAIAAERELSTDMWQGTVISGGFPGLDSQIATGQMDADTRTLCPALDSDVKDFNYDLVGGTGRSIVEYMSMMAYYLSYNAMTMGLDPAAWLVVMRPELWFELSAVWPCQYLSHRCSTTAANTPTLIINDNVNVSMRDAMRNGMYIDINGIRYPVVVDTGIFEHTNVNNANVPAGSYASSIYFVPTVINQNFPVTYREYVDYRDAVATTNVSFLNGTEPFWTDDGIYSWAIEYVKWCYKISLKTEQRVVLRTPQLAGKIQRCRYSPLQHLRSPDPSSSYFADGGVSVRGSSWGSAVWANTR